MTAMPVPAPIGLVLPAYGLDIVVPVLDANGLDMVVPPLPEATEVVLPADGSVVCAPGDVLVGTVEPMIVPL